MLSFCSNDGGDDFDDDDDDDDDETTALDSLSCWIWNSFVFFLMERKPRNPKGKFNVLQKFFINIPGRSTTESELCFLVHSIIRRLNHVSLTIIRTESISKLSNFNFQWTKTLYQNNLNNIAFFFTFFMGSRCN